MVLSVAFNLTAALSQPIADKKIVSVLEQIGGTFKIMLGCTVSVMLMIGITLVIKITNSGMMYR